MNAFLRPRKPPFIRGELGQHGDQWLMTEADLEDYARADRAQRVPLPDRLIRFTLRDLKAKREALNGFVALGNERERAREYDQWILSLERYIETAQDGGAND